MPEDFGFSKKFGREATSEEKSFFESLISKGASSDKTEKKSSTTLSDFSQSDVAGGLDLTGLITDAETFGSTMKSSLGSASSDLKFLTDQAQEIGNSMGIGRARAGELRSTIADTIPEMQKMGIEVSEGISKIAEIPTALKTNTTIANQTIIDLAATSKFTGVEVGSLVKEFSQVGTQLSSVGSEMAGVANYAKSVGVNVKEVTAGVVGNLKQLNLFNFDNGVQGLAKMQAQSAMLGVNMDKVFQKADSLLNPESAIEFSSALQRLGVTSSELLDPLSAMDMALNDPAKLQDQMTKVAQQFTRLKADGSGFEILPGAKLQLREVAKELGMSADELAGMAIKSSDLDMKLKQIRFPSFAASEEDRMLIANMSQMKDGKAVVQITDEKGTKQEVDVDQLTSEQLDKLKQDQANQAKSAEDLARDQLTVQTEIKNAIVGGGLGVRMGIASQPQLQRLADTNLEVRGAVAKNLYGAPTSKGVREATTEVSGRIEGATATLINEGFTSESLTKVGDIFATFPEDLGKQLQIFTDNLKIGAKNAYAESVSGVSSKYEGIGGTKKIEAKDVNTSTFDVAFKNIEDITKDVGNTIKEVFVKQTVDFTNSDGSLKNLPPEIYNALIEKFKNDPKALTDLMGSMDKVNQGV